MIITIKTSLEEKSPDKKILSQFLKVRSNLHILRHVYGFGHFSNKCRYLFAIGLNKVHISFQFFNQISLSVSEFKVENPTVKHLGLITYASLLK